MSLPLDAAPRGGRTLSDRIAIQEPMANSELAGRSYARVYRVSRRSDLHAFLLDAVRQSGGDVLYASDERRAPIYFGVQGATEERIGLLVYPFRATHNVIRNRPSDEHRLQIRYGSEPTWTQEHRLGRDVAGVDTTLVLGVHLQAGVFIGLDPFLYDPLPMGISVELKAREIRAASEAGWHVFERDNHGGRRRRDPRAPDGLETVVVFRPERLLDYVRLERQASDLGLDAALRFAAAQDAGTPRAATQRPGVFSLHALEDEFALSSEEILEIIATRSRLTVAVRGGVAEHHLERALSSDPAVESVQRLDEDAKPDFRVRVTGGRQVLIECKNASPRPYADGTIKVEVQKTRASRGDPASRLYRVDQFDAIAACLYSPTRQWTFRFQWTSQLTPDHTYPDRIAPIQRVSPEWVPTLGELVTTA